MANPVFTQSKAFQPGQPVGFDVNGTQPSGIEIPGQFVPGKMTYEGTIAKAATMFVLALAAAGIVGFVAPFLAMPLAIAAFVLSLVVAFTTNKGPKPGLFIATTTLYGGAAGGISAYYEATYGGIIMQALIGTGVVFAVSLAAYRFQVVRDMGKVNRFLTIAVPAYVIFSLINMGMVLFGGFNMRDVEIAGLGVKLGLILSVVAIFIGALMLISDFDFVDNGVRRGLDAKWEWTGAYGLVFSIIWIYLELLRLLSYLRGR